MHNRFYIHKKYAQLIPLLIVLLFSLLFLPTAVKGAGKETGNSPVGTVSLRENGIPVIYLTIDPEELDSLLSSPDHSYRAETCSIRIDVPPEYVCEYGEPDLSALEKELQLEYIRGRGNSTWRGSDKKAFKFKLEHSEDLLAMGANKHWVLMANAMDDTLLCNRLASYIGVRLGLKYTPLFVPADLVINGTYWGSYLLSHQVRIGKNRIDIEEADEDCLEEPDITGGYLLALEPDPGEAEINLITTQRGVHFLMDKPDLSEYTDPAAQTAQHKYIETFLQQVEDRIFGEDFRDEAGNSCWDLLDMESAARFWWVQEFSCNDDGMMTPSSYLYKVRDGKLYFGPLWDFDVSFWDSGSTLNICRMLWLDHLRAYNPEYQTLLRSVWDELDGILQEITCPGGVLDRWREEIRASWENNRDLWLKEYLQKPDLDKLTEKLRTRIEYRRKNIENVIDSDLTRVYATVTFTDGGSVLKELTVYAGELLHAGRFPKAPEKEGLRFIGWADENQEEAAVPLLLSQDIRLHAVYEAIPAETAAPAETAPVPTSAEAREEGTSSGLLLPILLAAVLVCGGILFFLRFNHPRSVKSKGSSEKNST